MAMVKGRPMPIRRLNKGPPKQAENPIRGYPAKEKNFSLIHFTKLHTMYSKILFDQFQGENSQSSVITTIQNS